MIFVFVYFKIGPNLKYSVTYILLLNGNREKVISSVKNNKLLPLILQ